MKQEAKQTPCPPAGTAGESQIHSKPVIETRTGAPRRKARQRRGQAMSEATLGRGREEMGAPGRRRSQDGSEGPKLLRGFFFVL